jgi:hypothetical protein
MFRELGRQLVELHLMNGMERGPGPGLVPAVELAGSFRIGGYEVIRRWQAKRKDRSLTAEAQAYIERLKFVAVETGRLALEIDVCWNAVF